MAMDLMIYIGGLSVWTDTAAPLSDAVIAVSANAGNTVGKISIGSIGIHPNVTSDYTNFYNDTTNTVAIPVADIATLIDGSRFQTGATYMARTDNNPRSSFIFDGDHYWVHSSAGVMMYKPTGAPTGENDGLAVGEFTPASITDTDTSPSVRGLRSIRTANTVTTVVTTFDDGFQGQEVEVFVDDGNTTFEDFYQLAISVTGITLSGTGPVRIGATAHGFLYWEYSQI